MINFIFFNLSQDIALRMHTPFVRLMALTKRFILRCNSFFVRKSSLLLARPRSNPIREEHVLLVVVVIPFESFAPSNGERTQYMPINNNLIVFSANCENILFSGDGFYDCKLCFYCLNDSKAEKSE